MVLFLVVLVVLIAHIIIKKINWSDIARKNKKKEKYNLAQDRGEYAETQVKNILSHFEGEDCKVINGCLLEFENGSTTQIDHIVVNRNGVYVIETKNYSGEVYKLNEKEWCHRNGTYDNVFYSPVKQNEGHIKSIMSKLGTKSTRYFHSIIAFSDKTKLPLVMNETVPVVHIKELGKELQKEKDVYLTIKDIDDIYTTIMKHNKNSKSYLKKHIRNINNKYC